MDDDAEDGGNSEGDTGPLFRPEDLEHYLNETPKPLVIDVEPLRMCSEQVEFLRHEVIRIVEQTVRHIQTIFPTMPIGRHLCLAVLRNVPGLIALKTRKTPWGRGGIMLSKGLRKCLAPALTERGIPAELVPWEVDTPMAPSHPGSLLSVDVCAYNDVEESPVDFSKDRD